MESLKSWDSEGVANIGLRNEIENETESVENV